MSKPKLRMARQDDAAAVREIYAPYVDTAVTFEVDVPTVQEFECRLAKTLQMYPWLVAEREGKITGYAYGCRHRDRPAYQWSVETSIYLARDSHRRGDGKLLYEMLFSLLRAQGYINAYAGITLPNAASVGFHEAMGFVPIGVYSKIGFKLGAWHDVGWWQLALAPHGSAPALPRPNVLLPDA